MLLLSYSVYARAEEYMSETSKPTTRSSRTKRLFVIAVVILLIPLLGYIGGYFVLPGSIQSAYEGKDCETVLSQHALFLKMYPFATSGERLESNLMECAVYLLAGREEQNQNWRTAYNAYQVYISRYPNGLFIHEAYGHSAMALFTLAQDQLAKENYADATVSLNLILSQYADTAVSADAQGIYAELYMKRGRGLRNAGDFAGSEISFKDFMAWLQNTQQSEQLKSIQLELAQTYLEWGKYLQSQKQFDDALTKFNLAISTDPDPQADSGPAMQAISGLVTLYTEWGDYLVLQNDFAGAMEYYETAARLSTDQNSAHDIIARGYIQWARAVSSNEDFIGALVLLDWAQENASTDPTKKMVTNTRSEVYLAFSKSSGEQAQKAMRDAIRIVCKHHTNLSLPIFGLDNDSILAGIYGVDEKLPENIAATTPGSMHYVACIEEDTKIVNSVILTYSSYFFDPNPPYTYIKVQFNRLQYIWAVTLRKVDTGKEIESTIVKGKEPPPIPTDPWERAAAVKNPQFFGPKPDVANLAAWLLTVMK